MTTEAVVMACYLIGTALLVAALALPLLLGKVPRNHLYGARFRQAQVSDDAWYAINRHAAVQLLRWCTLMAAAGIAAVFLPLDDNDGLTLAIAFLPVSVVIPALVSWRFARRYCG